MYLDNIDYKIVVGDTALKVISQASEENRLNAEMVAIEEISGYLRPRYDCNLLFNENQEQRNRQIVMIACDIALYHMSSSQPQKMGAEIREERYKRAIKWLEGVQSGKIVPDIPLSVNENGEPEGSNVIFGSEQQLHHNW